MMNPSHIHPDEELCEVLDGAIFVGSGTDAVPVKVYADWARPTNKLPDDFLVVFINGDIGGISMDTPFASGYLMVSLYSKMNDDGSVKANRIKKILEQFDAAIEKKITPNYYFEYDAYRFITPTTPNQSSGYSVTTLNLRWHTTNDFQTT